MVRTLLPLSTEAKLSSERPNFHLKVQVLLDNGADINAVTQKTRLTPLHIAALHKMPAIVAELLRRGADATMKDVDGRTPLDFTSCDESKSLLKEQLKGQ